MISIEYFIKPLRSQQSCGDFFHVKEREGDYLIVGGDVGGHGTLEVGATRKKIEELVEQNTQAGSFELFKAISSSSVVTKFGVMLFVGSLSKTLPILNYSCVGDLRLHLVRNGNHKRLQQQPGMIGTATPGNIDQYAIKFHENDIFAIGSDGISANFLDVFSGKPDSELAKVASHISQEYTSQNDDAFLGLVAISHISSVSGTVVEPNLPVTGANKEQFAENAVWDASKNENVRHQYLNVHHQNRESRRPPKIQAKIPVRRITSKPLPANAILLANLGAVEEARGTLKRVLEFFEPQEKFKITYQTVVLELMSKTTGGVKLYYHYNQIIALLNKAITNTCDVSTLINVDQLFQVSNTEYLAIICNVKARVALNSSVLDGFVERLSLGLDEKAYVAYQAEQKRDHLFSQQAKLASMGEMIGAIAHQWRQPLNELAMRIQALKYYIKKTEDLDAYLDQFVSDNMSTIQFMSKTIDDFRNFFRIDKEKSIFELREAIDEVVRMQAVQLQNNGIDLQIKGGNTNVYAFKSELQQVILNLINNARDALKTNNPEIKKIIIQINNDSLSVYDSGGGIPSSIISRVFEPYFTTKAHGEGTGMGLYMCKMIVEDNLKEVIVAENINGEYGTGARFTISLPKLPESQKSRVI